MSQWEDMQLGAAAYAALALVAGGLCLAARHWRPGRETPLPSAPPPGAWTGREVLFAFLVFVLVPDACQAMLQSLDFYDRFYGAPPSRERQQLWALLFAMPIMLAMIVGGLSLASGTRPDQVGLSRLRLIENGCAGYLGFLMMSPLVWSIHLVVTQLTPSRGHAFERILEHAVPAEWALVFFEAIVAAPLVEELVFRGVLQGWLGRADRHGHFVVAMMTVVVGSLGLVSFLFDPSGNTPFPGWEPAGFAILLAAVSLVLLERAFTARPGLVESSAPTHPYLAIWGTSALFAVVHSSAWPSPAPLFVLSLGLGWMAQRTRSLVGPIVCHALFNGISCLTLLFEALWPR